ncbi:MAG: type IV pilus twitching motility protein PilT [Ilumatobacteraceae bacterium]
MSSSDQNGSVALASPGVPASVLAPPVVATLKIPQCLDELLDYCLTAGGSDLHLAAGAPPTVRVDGVLNPIEGYGNLHGDMIERIVFAVLDDRKIAAFNSELELDTSYAIPGKSRFRMNVFRQRGAIGAVLRTIPFDIPTFDSLHMPAIIESFAHLPRGLVLVTGPSGSGKSTTLAALLDIINRTKAVHILSVEDPIEFLYSHKKAIVNQREVGEDTKSFAAALKRALREDPDVILVGEMRDLETIHMALTAAETGHLVFATLHTQSAPQTVDRIVDVFPPDQQGQIRVMLATTLQAVVTQQLLPSADGHGRAAAVEVLIATPAVRNLIRERKGYQLASQMQAGSKFGMVTMDQNLAELVRSKRITLETALERAASPDDLRSLLGLKPAAAGER